MKKLILFLALACAFAACGPEKPTAPEPESTGQSPAPVVDCADSPGPAVCFADRGVNPTKAALAVAALGRQATAKGE